MHLQLFCQEEFLRRLALSKYANHLVLKGGLFIYTLTNFESRATIDVDFLLRQLPNSVEEIEKIVKEILNEDTGNDFIELTANSFGIITPQRKYKGVSCQMIGKIKNTRTPFSIDIGVGDIIVPKAEKRLIPVQLEEFTHPEIFTYSLESTIAEKLDAILQRLEMTSRMKDFYDIYYLSKMFDFDGFKLQEAILKTLKNRGTSYNENSLAQVAHLAYDSGMLVKWKHALKTIKKNELAFEDVVKTIVNFLNPVWNSINKEEEFHQRWDKSIEEWIKS